MRLFAAVLPPEQAVAELALAVDRLRSLPGAGHLRWTGPADWHFTLAFMGKVDEELLPDLHERLGRAAHRTAPFPLRLHQGGRFGQRALWVGAAGGIEEMSLLADRAEAAARRAGVSMEEHRRYHAHLTIARGGRTSRTRRISPTSRTEADLRPYVAALEALEGTPWEVGQLVLVRSNLPVSGIAGEQPRYETVGSWPLERAS